MINIFCHMAFHCQTSLESSIVHGHAVSIVCPNSQLWLCQLMMQIHYWSDSLTHVYTFRGDILIQLTVCQSLVQATASWQNTYCHAISKVTKRLSYHDDFLHALSKIRVPMHLETIKPYTKGILQPCNIFILWILSELMLLQQFPYLQTSSCMHG